MLCVAVAGLMKGKAAPKVLEEMKVGQGRTCATTHAIKDSDIKTHSLQEDDDGSDSSAHHAGRQLTMGEKKSRRESDDKTPPLCDVIGDDDPKSRERKRVRLLGETNSDVTPRQRSPATWEGIPRSPRLTEDSRRRKLILHLDLRNTILVADSITNVAVEQALNAFLTGATWGEEKGGQWCWTSDQPSVNSPTHQHKASGAGAPITYYKYLERQLVRTPSERTSLRLATGDFTQTPIGNIFQQHFQVHLQRLKWKYPSPKDAGSGGVNPHSLLTMKGSDGQLYHYILEGVYRLMHHLHRQQRHFALVIRTYGLDAPNALKSLAHGLVKGHHPGYPQPLRMPVNCTPGVILRPADDVIVLESYSPNSPKDLEVKLTHERDIYRHLSASQGISGYKDDFKYWQDHNYNHHSGKPLWIDPHDSKHHHIIFDDNFRALDEDSIVDVRVFSQEKTTRAYSLTKTQLSHLEDVCLVQADLLESIDDRDYFVRKVELCEANYALMLKTNSFPG